MFDNFKHGHVHEGEKLLRMACSAPKGVCKWDELKLSELDATDTACPNWELASNWVQVSPEA